MDTKGIDLKKLGERIRELRGNESQAVIAVRAGIAQGYWSEIERGEKEPSLDVLSRIATVFGLDLSDLTAPELLRLPSVHVMGTNDSEDRPSTIETSLGERIRTARGNISARKLAIAAEISPSFLSDIELGKTDPSVETLKKIASVLSVSTSYLLGETDNPSPLRKAFLGVNTFSGVKPFPEDSGNSQDEAAGKSDADVLTLLAVLHDLKKADPRFQAILQAEAQRKAFNVSLYASAYDNASQFASEATTNEIKAAMDLSKMTVESLEIALEKKRATD